MDCSIFIYDGMDGVFNRLYCWSGRYNYGNYIPSSRYIHTRDWFKNFCVTEVEKYFWEYYFWIRYRYDRIRDGSARRSWWHGCFKFNWIKCVWYFTWSWSALVSLHHYQTKWCWWYRESFQHVTLTRIRLKILGGSVKSEYARIFKLNWLYLFQIGFEPFSSGVQRFQNFTQILKFKNIFRFTSIRTD